jgi:hypothetical protein
MNSLLKSGWSFLMVLFFAQCNRCKEPEVDPPSHSTETTYQFHWNSVFDQQDLVQGQTYSDHWNRRFLIEDLRGYVSQIKVYNEMDSAILLKDYALLNWLTDPKITVKAQPWNVTKIEFSLGVPANVNTLTDPTTYANNHPLSVAGSSGMFWTWNTGYIFYMLNGKTDLTGSATAPLIDPIAYHCGDDTLYRTLTFYPTPIQTKAGESYTWNFEFDAQKCFQNETDTMDFETEYLTHTTGNLPLAIKAMDLYQSAFQLIP